MRYVLIAILAACGGAQPLQGSQKDTDGDGVRDIEDKCAYDPGPGTPNGCPQKESEIKVLEGDHAPGNPPPAAKAMDRDGDGVGDDMDRCPDEPEDKDGFEDADGCPDIDNDRDGIRDIDDLCPNDAEDKDGVKDEDGCPER